MNLDCLIRARFRKEPEALGMYAINHCFASIEISADDKLHTRAANHRPFTPRAWGVIECDR